MTAHRPSFGLEATFLQHREKLLRFLRARGAGDAAEDLVQEIWLKISTGQSGPVSSPLSYLFRTADLLMIDRYRALRQARIRDRAWHEAYSDGGGRSLEPSADRRLVALQEAEQVTLLIEALGPRVLTTFRRHRIDGIAQRQVAAELGVSLSTVESDLRSAYRALAEWKERRNEV